MSELPGVLNEDSGTQTLWENVNLDELAAKAREQVVAEVAAEGLPAQDVVDAWSRASDGLEEPGLVEMGAGLLFMVVLDCVAVVMRFDLGQPMLGANEIVQFVSVGVVMLALPWCTDQNGHVRADVFDNAIGRSVGDSAV